MLASLRLLLQSSLLGSSGGQLKSLQLLYIYIVYIVQRTICIEKRHLEHNNAINSGLLNDISEENKKSFANHDFCYCRWLIMAMIILMIEISDLS